MIYLDHGATSFPKPEPVIRAMGQAARECANPGRGSHRAAELAARTLYRCREGAGELFRCNPEQVVFTLNCTHGLNMALRSLVRWGDRVVISGFEHNAVTRTLRELGAEVIVAGQRLFDRENTLRSFTRALDRGAKAAVFTHVSNVFGYILPVEEMAAACKKRRIPFVLDAAQSAGAIPIDMKALGADFIAMPGHKGLLGPMGTGMLLCARLPRPFFTGGTGSNSLEQRMPDVLPDRGEAGTMNVPGIAGLEAGIRLILDQTPERIGAHESALAAQAAKMLRELGMEVFSGKSQLGTVSFRTEEDCEDFAQRMAERGIALRSGLHCAPLAHRSAGTLETGTVRLSLGASSREEDLLALKEAILEYPTGKKSGKSR